jgi:hypothetical protein
MQIKSASIILSSFSLSVFPPRHTNCESQFYSNTLRLKGRSYTYHFGAEE